jgi:16S rRNA pseudouridine516 synthase
MMSPASIRRAGRNGAGNLRLDRFVSQAVGISRSQARVLIRRGQVSVAGHTVRQAAHQVDAGQAVEYAGGRLELPQPVYLMLHKPCGLLSATTDPAQSTVLSLLPPALAARVHLVGRLDKDTSGLLLLTDDGTWSHRVSSPRQGCDKTYRAELAGPLIADAEERLLQGLVLRSETEPTRPAVLQRLDATHVRITISEGRYHQVRRMFAALGNRVVSLHRERIGGLCLDATLAPGQWRVLSGEEREAVLGGSCAG